MSPLLKTALFTVVVPGSVAVLVPLLIAGDRAAVDGAVRVLGLLLLGLGGVLYLRSAWDFASFGRGTPAITDALDAAAERGPADWIVRALRLAARHNVRRWAYAESVLRRWEAEGIEEEGGTADAEPGQDHERSARRDHGPYERVIRRS